MDGTTISVSELFRELSAVLTGEVEIAASTADRHLATLQTRLGVQKVAAALDRFAAIKTAPDLDQAVRTDLIEDAELGPTAKAMVLLWFVGVPDPSPGAPGPESEADFFEAQMWTALGAHAPAYSDGYYGHWRYPPDTGV